MKGLTLWQPWASAIAVGSKKVETRGRRFNYRGMVAIHAALKMDMALAATAIYMRKILKVPLPDPLPLGHVLAVADLIGCVPSEEYDPTPLEAELGGFGPGRWVLILDRITAIEPVKMGGKQGLWRIRSPLPIKVLAP